MKILSIPRGDELDACAIFDYKGYEISVSTRDRQAIVFPNRESSEVLCISSASIEGIMECKKWVDETIENSI